MGYEYQEKFVNKANEILANQMKTKPEWIDRKALIKALEANFNTDWADYASKNNFGKDYIDGVRDEYDDVLTIICKQRNLTDEETEIYNSWIEAEAADVQPVVETEDLATATEQFICKNCGIRIENFDKIILEEDNDGYIDKLFCEYIFKFCPECGAKVKGGDTE